MLLSIMVCMAQEKREMDSWHAVYMHVAGHTTCQTAHIINALKHRFTLEVKKYCSCVKKNKKICMFV